MSEQNIPQVFSCLLIDAVNKVDTSRWRHMTTSQFHCKADIIVIPLTSNLWPRVTRARNCRNLIWYAMQYNIWYVCSRWVMKTRTDAIILNMELFWPITTWPIRRTNKNDTGADDSLYISAERWLEVDCVADISDCRVRLVATQSYINNLGHSKHTEITWRFAVSTDLGFDPYPTAAVNQSVEVYCRFIDIIAVAIPCMVSTDGRWTAQRTHSAVSILNEKSTDWCPSRTTNSHLPYYRDVVVRQMSCSPLARLSTSTRAVDWWSVVVCTEEIWIERADVLDSSSSHEYPSNIWRALRAGRHQGDPQIFGNINLKRLKFLSRKSIWNVIEKHSPIVIQPRTSREYCLNLRGLCNT